MKSELGYRVIEALMQAGLQPLMSDEKFELLVSDVGLAQLDGPRWSSARRRIGQR